MNLEGKNGFWSLLCRVMQPWVYHSNIYFLIRKMEVGMIKPSFPDIQIIHVQYYMLFKYKVLVPAMCKTHDQQTR